MEELHLMTRRFLRSAYEGNKEEVLQLLDEGVPVHSTHQSGLQAIHFAAKSGNVEMTTALLDRGASVNARSQKGSTPLHIGALLGKTDVVKLLLKSGADVNSLSMYNQEMFTALYMAAQIGHQEIVTLLLAYGADPTIQTNNGSTAKFVAAQQGFPVIAQILEEFETQKCKQERNGVEEGVKSRCLQAGASDLNEDVEISLAKLNLSEETLVDESSSENKENKKTAFSSSRQVGFNSERKIESGKSIVLKKLKTSLSPMYMEAIPSPLSSPKRALKKKIV